MFWATIFGQFAVQCQNPRIRKDFRRYTDGEWNDYIQAVRQLKHSGELSKYAGLHMQIYDTIHSHRTFLTWHRAFIYEFETKLREVSGKPITLPYIDWAGEADQLQGAIEKSVAFNGYYYGQMKGSCLDGNIYDTFVLRPDLAAEAQHPCVYNQFDTSQAVGGWSTIDTMIFNDKEFNVFSDELEGTTHFMVHTRIGGNMISKMSPMFPAFYAHHSFIDLLLSTWQYVHNKWTNIPEVGQQTFKILSGKTYTHEDVFQMKDMCVKYERYHQSQSSQDRAKLDPKLLKRMSELEDVNNILQATQTQTEAAGATETHAVNAYKRPAYKGPSDAEVKSYNTELNNYYTEVQQLYRSNNTRNSTDPESVNNEAYQKCTKFYGNNSYIPIITSLPSKRLEAFQINQTQYQQSVERKNARNIQVAKQANIPVHTGNQQTKSYNAVSNNLVGVYQKMAQSIADYKPTAPSSTLPSTSTAPTSNPGYSSSSSRATVTLLNIILLSVY